MWYPAAERVVAAATETRKVNDNSYIFPFQPEKSIKIEMSKVARPNKYPSVFPAASASRSISYLLSFTPSPPFFKKNSFIAHAW